MKPEGMTLRQVGTRPGAVDVEVSIASTVHACPSNVLGRTSCCGRTPFELPRFDRMTFNDRHVTCEGEADRG